MTDVFDWSDVTTGPAPKGPTPEWTAYAHKLTSDWIMAPTTTPEQLQTWAVGRVRALRGGVDDEA